MEILKTSLLGLFFGTTGTTLGGIIGIFLKNISNRFISFVLALASGLMLSIVCFELVPESYQNSNIVNSLIGITLGVITMIVCDIIVKNKIQQKTKTASSLLKTGIVISIGLAIHNIPEGLAIGTGFESSLKLGYSLAIAIAIHDIPEGLSMSVPMKQSGISARKILLYVFFSGVTTGIGALVGAITGMVSENVISISLSFAAGAMLYIVSGELTPEYTNLYNGKLSTLGNILGFIFGFIASNL